MIEENIKKWHAQIRGEFPGGLDALLADDVTFYSPIVFTPQQGKEVTKLYLTAASGTFGGESKSEGGGGKTTFRYVKEVLSGNHAVLEFEDEVGGKYVNGVDIITFNDAGQICDFKVMIRPLQAVNLIHARMKAMLEKLQA